MMVEGGGFEPPKAYAGRFTVCSLWPLGHPSIRFHDLSLGFVQAGEGTRTPNPLITNEMLYQLSYASAPSWPEARKEARPSQGSLASVEGAYRMASCPPP